MTMKNVLILAFLTLLTACGPSSEEKARLQKEREDSIKVAAENAAKYRVEMKLALTDSVKNFEALKEGFENRLSYLKGELEVAKDKLSTAKQVQFLRTPEERERQIRDQTLIIDGLETEIKELPMKIETTVDKIAKTKLELKRIEE